MWVWVGVSGREYRGRITPVKSTTGITALASTAAPLAYLGSKSVTWFSMRLFFSVILVLLADAK